jgi:2-dehydropantoate 2-reductase
MIDFAKPKYLVFGTGALGSVFGGFLQENGCDVTYVGRGEHFKAVSEKG